MWPVFTRMSTAPVFVLTTYDDQHILATLPIGNHLEYKN